MNLKQYLDQQVEAGLTASGAEHSPAVVRQAGKPEFGHYQANGIMGAAKKLGQNPRELAQQVAQLREHLQRQNQQGQGEQQGQGGQEQRLKKFSLRAKGQSPEEQSQQVVMQQEGKDKKKAGPDKGDGGPAGEPQKVLELGILLLLASDSLILCHVWRRILSPFLQREALALLIL